MTQRSSSRVARPSLASARIRWASRRSAAAIFRQRVNRVFFSAWSSGRNVGTSGFATGWPVSTLNSLAYFSLRLRNPFSSSNCLRTQFQGRCAAPVLDGIGLALHVLHFWKPRELDASVDDGLSENRGGSLAIGGTLTSARAARTSSSTQLQPQPGRPRRATIGGSFLTPSTGQPAPEAARSACVPAAAFFATNW